MKHFGLILWAIVLFSFDNYNSFIVGAKIGMVVGPIIALIKWRVDENYLKEYYKSIGEEYPKPNPKPKDRRSFADRFYDFFYRK